MTSTQLVLMVGFYLTVFIAALYFTRAGIRRTLGALAGGAIFGIIGLAAVILGERQHWWVIPDNSVPHFYSLLWLGLAISSAPDYLVLWRIVRRFGMRGLVWSVVIVAIIGPPRDYAIAAAFPTWMTFSPGIAPVVADDLVYIMLVLVGYAVMRAISGPDQADALARAK